MPVRFRRRAWGKSLHIAIARTRQLARRRIEWFLAEQVEEEAAMHDLLQVAERTREIPMLLEEYVAREHGD